MTKNAPFNQYACRVRKQCKQIRSVKISMCSERNCMTGASIFLIIFALDLQNQMSMNSHYTLQSYYFSIYTYVLMIIYNLYMLLLRYSHFCSISLSDCDIKHHGAFLYKVVLRTLTNFSILPKHSTALYLVISLPSYSRTSL